MLDLMLIRVAGTKTVVIRGGRKKSKIRVEEDGGVGRRVKGKDRGKAAGEACKC